MMRKMELSRKTSERIKAIGFVCALMVVAIHCVAIPKGWWNGSVDIPRWIVALHALGTDALARLAVPWFFVISGFFLVKGIRDVGENDGCCRLCGLFRWWRSSFVKRMLTLGVPYLLWNLIYYLFKILTGKYGFEGWHCFDQLIGYDLHNVPACGQFWYLRNILLYVACAPLFVVLFCGKRIGLFVLLGLLFCWIAGVKWPFEYMQITDFRYAAYFGAGVYLGLRRRVVVFGKYEGFARLIFTLVTITAAGGVVFGVVARNVQIVGISNKVLIIFGLPTLWLIGDWIVFLTARWRNLYGLAFFVYAVHVILVSVTHKITFAVLSPMLYDSVGYLLKIAVGVLGSIVIGFILSKIAPNTLKILCGGRG